MRSESPSKDVCREEGGSGPLHELEPQSESRRSIIRLLSGSGKAPRRKLPSHHPPAFFSRASPRAWSLPACSTPTHRWLGGRREVFRGGCAGGRFSQSTKRGRTVLAPAPPDIDTAGQLTSLPG